MSKRQVNLDINKKEKIKNIIIFILVLAFITFAIMYLLKFNNSNRTKQLIKDSLRAQASISEYIGKMKSDTFDIYTIEQLLVGSANIEDIEATRIKDNNENNILQIVTKQDKIIKNNVTFYKLNVDELEKKIGLKLYEDDNIEWYIQSNGDIKINYTNKPNWWTDELDAIHIGA